MPPSVTCLDRSYRASDPRWRGNRGDRPEARVSSPGQWTFAVDAFENGDEQGLRDTWENIISDIGSDWRSCIYVSHVGLMSDNGADCPGPRPCLPPPGDRPGGGRHLLTPSEITAYLMWLDINQRPKQEEFYVTGAIRAGAYGLTREAYETHRALEAFGLIDVTPDPDSHDDGKYTGYPPTAAPRRATASP